MYELIAQRPMGTDEDMDISDCVPRRTLPPSPHSVSTSPCSQRSHTAITNSSPRSSHGAFQGCFRHASKGASSPCSESSPAPRGTTPAGEALQSATRSASLRNKQVLQRRHSPLSQSAFPQAPVFPEQQAHEVTSPAHRPSPPPATDRSLPRMTYAALALRRNSPAACTSSGRSRRASGALTPQQTMHNRAICSSAAALRSPVAVTPMQHQFEHGHPPSTSSPSDQQQQSVTDGVLNPPESSITHPGQQAPVSLLQLEPFAYVDGPTGEWLRQRGWPHCGAAHPSSICEAPSALSPSGQTIRQEQSLGILEYGNRQALQTRQQGGDEEEAHCLPHHEQQQQQHHHHHQQQQQQQQQQLEAEQKTSLLPNLLVAPTPLPQHSFSRTRQPGNHTSTRNLREQLDAVTPVPQQQPRPQPATPPLPVASWLEHFSTPGVTTAAIWQRVCSTPASPLHHTPLSHGAAPGCLHAPTCSTSSTLSAEAKDSICATQEGSSVVGFPTVAALLSQASQPLSCLSGVSSPAATTSAAAVTATAMTAAALAPEQALPCSEAGCVTKTGCGEGAATTVAATTAAAAAAAATGALAPTPASKTMHARGISSSRLTTEVAEEPRFLKRTVFSGVPPYEATMTTNVSYANRAGPYPKHAHTGSGVYPTPDPAPATAVKGGRDESDDAIAALTSRLSALRSSMAAQGIDQKREETST